MERRNFSPRVRENARNRSSAPWATAIMHLLQRSLPRDNCYATILRTLAGHCSSMTLARQAAADDFRDIVHRC